MSKADLDAFGVTKEELDATQDINPTLRIAQYFENHSYMDVTFTQAKPEMVKVKDDKGKEEERPVISVDLDGVEYSLWLSAKTLRLGVGKVANEHGFDLDGVTVRITQTPAHHETYGDYNAYNVQEISEQRNNLAGD